MQEMLNMTKSGIRSRSDSSRNETWRHPQSGWRWPRAMFSVELLRSVYFFPLSSLNITPSPDIMGCFAYGMVFVVRKHRIYPDGSCCSLICGEKKHIPASTHVQGDQTLPHADRHPKSVLGFTESNKGGNGYPTLIQYNDPLPLPRVWRVFTIQHLNFMDVKCHEFQKLRVIHEIISAKFLTHVMWACNVCDGKMALLQVWGWTVGKA